MQIVSKTILFDCQAIKICTCVSAPENLYFQNLFSNFVSSVLSFCSSTPILWVYTEPLANKTSLTSSLTSALGGFKNTLNA